MKTDTQMVFRNKGIFMQALFRVFGGKYILGSNICVFIIIFRTVFLGTTKFGEEKIVWRGPYPSVANRISSTGLP